MPNYEEYENRSENFTKQEKVAISFITVLAGVFLLIVIGLWVHELWEMFGW